MLFVGIIVFVVWIEEEKSDYELAFRGWRVIGFKGVDVMAIGCMLYGIDPDGYRQRTPCGGLVYTEQTEPLGACRLALEPDDLYVIRGLAAQDQYIL